MLTIIFTFSYFPRWFVKRIGIPVPFIPYGYFGLPIPRQCPISIIVGKPVAVTQNSNPTQEEISKVQQEYYGQIQELFSQFSEECGQDDKDLVFLGREGEVKF